MAPMRPMTDIKRRNIPQAVIPPTIGRLVTIPDTLPKQTNWRLINKNILYHELQHQSIGKRGKYKIY